MYFPYEKSSGNQRTLRCRRLLQKKNNKNKDDAEHSLATLEANRSYGNTWEQYTKFKNTDPSQKLKTRNRSLATTAISNLGTTIMKRSKI